MKKTIGTIIVDDDTECDFVLSLNKHEDVISIKIGDDTYTANWAGNMQDVFIEALKEWLTAPLE